LPLDAIGDTTKSSLNAAARCSHRVPRSMTRRCRRISATTCAHGLLLLRPPGSRARRVRQPSPASSPHDPGVAVPEIPHVRRGQASAAARPFREAPSQRSRGLCSTFGLDRGRAPAAHGAAALATRSSRSCLTSSTVFRPRCRAHRGTTNRIDIIEDALLRPTGSGRSRSTFDERRPRAIARGACGAFRDQVQRHAAQPRRAATDGNCNGDEIPFDLSAMPGRRLVGGHRRPTPPLGQAESAPRGHISSRDNRQGHSHSSGRTSGPAMRQRRSTWRSALIVAPRRYATVYVRQRNSLTTEELHGQPGS